MELKKENPPNIEAIKKAFNIEGKVVFFAYGDILYNPSGGVVHKHVWVHEEMHSEQQGRVGGAAIWWEKYISDPVFRLEQEAEAYGVQFKYAKPLLNAKGQKEFLAALAHDLSGQMYGNIIKYREAESLIRHKSI